MSNLDKCFKLQNLLPLGFCFYKPLSVFFIEKDASGNQAGSNVFIATHKLDKETITSARSGHVEIINGEKFLVLQNGQRLEKVAGKPDLTVAAFTTYGAQVDADDQSARSFVPSAARSTLELLANPTKAHLAELAWRAGLALAAINFVVIGLAAAGVNPRVGRAANLGFAFGDAVVAPFPQQAAHETRMTLDKLEVIFQVAGAVTHAMAVFAHQVRLVRLLVKERLNAFQGRIHVAEQINVGKIILALDRKSVV